MEYKFEFSNNGFPKWKFHFIRGLPADRSTVHGDLTPPNVLITAEGAGCLADFGLSSIFDQNFAFTHSTTSAMGGVRRYEAPEILNAPAGTRKNHASDVYAFACVSYYVLADREPFFELANLNPFQLVEHIANGGRPLWPTETPQPEETVWSLFQQCWETDPNQRPNISQIIHRLSSSPVDSAVTPRTHWDETTTARSRHALQDASLLPSPAMIERRLMGNDLVALQYRAARLHMSGIEHFQAKRVGTDGPSEFPIILETYSSIDPDERRINQKIKKTTLSKHWDNGVRFPDAELQKVLAEELDLDVKQVKNWFSHKREKARNAYANTPLEQISSTPGDNLLTSLDGLQPPRAVPRLRRTFTEEEDRVLLERVAVHGQNWVEIAQDPLFKKTQRRSVDLSDHFRYKWPDKPATDQESVWRLKMDLLAQGETKSEDLIPRPGGMTSEPGVLRHYQRFEFEEDEALRTGFERYGAQWARIAREYPVFENHYRRGCDLRDRFRSAWPDKYKAAGYKGKPKIRELKGQRSQGQHDTKEDGPDSSAGQSNVASRSRRLASSRSRTSTSLPVTPLPCLHEGRCGRKAPPACSHGRCKTHCIVDKNGCPATGHQPDRLSALNRRKYTQATVDEDTGATSSRFADNLEGSSTSASPTGAANSGFLPDALTSMNISDHDDEGSQEGGWGTEEGSSTSSPMSLD